MSARRLHAAIALVALPLLVHLAAPRAASTVLARPPAQPPAGQGDRSHMAYLPVAQKAWSDAAASLGDPWAPGLGNPGYDVGLYDLRFKFDVDTSNPEAPRVGYQAKAYIDAKSTVDALDRVSVDFRLPVGVTAVWLEDVRANWWAGPGNKVWVAFPRPLAAGEVFHLMFEYGARSGPNAMIGFSVSRQGEASAQVWTPVGGAGTWFPANNHPSDRAKFVFTLDTPGDYVAVANGRRKPVADTAAGHLVDYVMEAEMAPSDAVINIAKFNVVEGISRGGTPVRHYLLRTADQARPALRAIERAVDFFAERIDPYGYASFGVVETGGNNSASVASLYLLGRNQAGQRPVYFDRTAGALVASQWFGSAVGVASPRDNWLNTGLASYLGILYQARDQGPEIVRARMAAYESSYGIGVTNDIALTELPADGSGGTVAGNKAPWAFHALRLALSRPRDDAWWTALGTYFRARLGGSADLGALELAAGDLGQALPSAFDKLFRQAATPRANLAWVQDGATVRVRVCQLTPSALTFDLPVALHAGMGVTDAAGAERKSLAINQADQTFDLAITGTIAAITPDPDQVMLADIIVLPMGSGPLPACSALPAPALASTASTTGTTPADMANGSNTAAEPEAEAFAWSVDPAEAEIEANKALHAAEGLAHGRHAQRDNDDRDDNGDRDDNDDPYDRAGTDALVPGEPSMGDPYIAYLGNTGYDVQKYTVKVNIDPAARKVTGDITVEALATIDDLDRLSLDFMRMRGDNGLVVQSVSVDGSTVAFERPGDADKLWIDLPVAKAKDAAFAIRVQYFGTPVPGGADVFSGGLLPHGSGTMYAISEPDGTRNWIPSNDHPRDKALYRFEVTVPIAYVAAANGVQVSQTATDTETTTIFEMRQPMSSYLATVAVGRYRTADQTGPNGVAIRHYFLNEPEVGMRVAGVTPDILDVIGKLVAPYAFDTYGHYAAPDFGGGMENQTMTAIGPGSFSSRTPRGQHSLIAHEAAHQWFGDALSPYSWADIWLNEGFATYFAELWRASKVGPEPLGWRMEGLRYTVLSRGLDAPVSQPILDDMFGVNTYEKGGTVLHVLRAELGETAFWTGIRDYFNRFKYGNVRTDDLQAVLEEASGKDLEAAFGQWVHRRGNPTLLAAWHQDGPQVTVRLCQPGTPFDLPVVLAVHGAGQPVRSTSRSTGAEALVKVDLPAALGDVSGVTVDPDFTLLADVRVQRVPADGAIPTCAVMVAEW